MTHINCEKMIYNIIFWMCRYYLLIIPEFSNPFTPQITLPCKYYDGLQALSTLKLSKFYHIRSNLIDIFIIKQYVHITV